MTDPLDIDGKERSRRDREKLEKRAREQFQADFRALMERPECRRVIYGFMLEMGLDTSTFNQNAMSQSYVNGKRDAALWWQEEVRRLVPHHEYTMRQDFIAMQKRLKPEADDNEH